MKEALSKHLKSESYYSDLYDRFTVDECREIEKADKNRQIGGFLVE